MSTPASEPLIDAEELMHLALNSMEQDRNDEAIGFLKRAIALAPDDGMLYYLLSSVHAEIGLIQRAMEELQHAVSLAPDFFEAHFQLGLLFMAAGDHDGAMEAWKPLERLDGDHPLSLYKKGMEQLFNNEPQSCINSLKRGIASSDNETLNRMMRQAMEQVQTAIESGALDTQEDDTPSKESAASAPPPKQPQTRRVLFGGYAQEED